MGSFNFKLHNSAGTRTIFLAAKGATVTAMVVVQTEAMTTQADRYVYPLQPGIKVAGTLLRVNAFAASDLLSARRSPNAEADLTMQFLAHRGIGLPDEWLNVRFATHDATGSNEFLVFYREPLDTDALDLTAIGPADLPLFATAFDDVRRRAEAALTFTACP